MQQSNIKTAVVTGASQGIGKAIASALAQDGKNVVIAGRNPDKLEAEASQFGATRGTVRFAVLDLTDHDSIANFSNKVRSFSPTLDILVHCAGAYARNAFDRANDECFSQLLQTNVIGPSMLTRTLLPDLKKSSGDIVFVNSSVVFSHSEFVGEYAATKHAMRGIANALRAEVNKDGVRVLSIFPGRTATPGQESIFAQEGKKYYPDQLLQSNDIAEVILACINLPATAEVVDLHIRPRYQTPNS